MVLIKDPRIARHRSYIFINRPKNIVLSFRENTGDAENKDDYTNEDDGDSFGRKK